MSRVKKTKMSSTRLRKLLKKKSPTTKGDPLGHSIDLSVAPGIRESTALDAFEWTQKYLKVFKDFYLEKVFKVALTRKYITKTFIEQVNKRRIHIYEEEIEHPETEYVPKYINIISVLCQIERGTVKDEVASNLLEFFQKFNYLTNKQRGLIRGSIQKKHGIRDKRSSNPAMIRLAGNIIERNMKSHITKENEKTGKSFTKSVIDEGIKRAKKEKKEQVKREKKIEKGFLSVTELRYRLRAKE